MYVCYFLVITYVSCNDILMFWISLNKSCFFLLLKTTYNCVKSVNLLPVSNETTCNTKGTNYKQ